MKVLLCFILCVRSLAKHENMVTTLLSNNHEVFHKVAYQVTHETLTRKPFSAATMYQMIDLNHDTHIEFFILIYSNTLEGS